MRPVATLFMCLFTGLATAAEPEQTSRRAMVVAIPGPGSGVVPLEQAQDHAGRLSETLKTRAGFDQVSTLLGDQVTADELVGVLSAEVAGIRDDGLLLVVLVAHGAGGDFGDPALLTRGASVSDPSGTGLSMDALASALRPRTPDQNIVVIMDVAHDGAVGGVALIGPAASDWPGLPEWGLTVTSKAAGEGGAPGKILPVVDAGISGEADANFDGQVTIGELAQFLDTTLSPEDGAPLDRAGAVAANLVLSHSGREKPAAVSPNPAGPALNGSGPFRLKPAAVGLVGAGAIAGLISVGMYASKRGECEHQADQLVCGDDDAYRRYRTMQVALGWTGAGLFAAGVGVQFIPTTQGAMVGVTGRF